MSKFQHWPAANILALYRLADVNDAAEIAILPMKVCDFWGGTLAIVLFGNANSSKYLFYDSLGKD